MEDSKKEENALSKSSGSKAAVREEIMFTGKDKTGQEAEVRIRITEKNEFVDYYLHCPWHGRTEDFEVFTTYGGYRCRCKHCGADFSDHMMSLETRESERMRRKDATKRTSR